MAYLHVIQVRNVVWPSVTCVSTLAHDHLFTPRENPNLIQYELCSKEPITSDYTNYVICVLEYYVI